MESKTETIRKRTRNKNCHRRYGLCDEAVLSKEERLKELIEDADE